MLLKVPYELELDLELLIESRGTARL